MEAGINHGRVSPAIPGYALGKTVRMDAAGVVVLAEQLDTGRTLELRLIASELAAMPQFAKRLHREAGRSASFHHPNLLPVYDLGEHDGTLFVASRAAGAVTLALLLEEPPGLERSRVVSLLSQAGAALDSAHSRGLAHRGISPAALLVGDGDHVYVADFGVVAPPEERGLIGRRLSEGLPPLGYAAPEQIAGQPVDGRADVYAIGCVAFRALTGQEAFDGRHGDVALEARLTEPPPSARTVDDSLPVDADEVIAKAMAPDPRERHPTVGEFVAALSPTLASTGRARPVPIPVFDPEPESERPQPVRLSVVSPPPPQPARQPEPEPPPAREPQPMPPELPWWRDVPSPARGPRPEPPPPLPARAEPPSWVPPVEEPRRGRGSRALTLLATLLLIGALAGGYILGTSGDPGSAGSTEELEVGLQPAAQPGSPAARYGARLHRVIARLNDQRERENARLRSARTARGQSRVAARLARAHAGAARSLRSGAPPRSLAGADRAIRSALARTGRAYRRMSRAARRSSRRAYRRAARAVAGGEVALRRSLIRPVADG